MSHLCEFLQSIDDLQRIVQHETFLLKEGKMAEAVKLFALKEAAVRKQTLLQEKLTQENGFEQLEPSELEEILEVLGEIKRDLFENQYALEGAYKAQQTLIHLCVEAIKSAKDMPRLYNQQGGLNQAFQCTDTIAVNRKL